MTEFNPITSLRDAQEIAADAAKLSLAYLKQETVGPLKAAGRYLAFGLSGSLMLAVGVFFLSLGVLRVLQDETGSTFHGHLSWAPYGLTVVFGLLITGLCAAGASKGLKAVSKGKKGER